ncbi:4-galactosyl-N-acetylglucosaminide 3-alpha-L-fucosyltransferase 9-like [Aplysia californica]|uniref:Fucosyltransferase n=1 Tax=Aplysia californica TaxID=6500 RepID=A0ABM0JSB9_APLCA|nr:4-galactosyl-N-acetylglucosaminide 3-alpha-L-fucosyltransferase 9-like [Aplysia californica]
MRKFFMWLVLATPISIAVLFMTGLQRSVQTRFTVNEQTQAKTTRKPLTPRMPPYISALKYFAETDPDTFKATKDTLIPSGYGLDTFVDKDGSELLVENGVFFRPFPYRENPNNTYYRSQFEPHIPWDPDVFFQGNKSRMLEFEKLKRRDLDDEAGGSLGVLPKIIMWWQYKPAAPPILGLERLRFCPDLPCVLTSNRNYSKQSSAMLVNSQFIKIKSRPPPRRPEQVLVYYQIEAPVTKYWRRGGNFDNPSWNHIFNWTMSYRMDADITFYHGVIRKRLRQTPERDYEAIVKRKRKLVAWLSSNSKTQSKRQEYFSELLKYIPIDNLARRTAKCSKKRDPECLSMINETYKFYLSFESAMCDDYITEKLFKYYGLDLITVVRGTNQYTEHAPKGTYINAADFSSPKELAEYLLYLDQHDEEFIKLLKEKDKYFNLYEDFLLKPPWGNFNMEYRYEATAFCHMCHRLWNLEDYRKTVADVRVWFNSSKCYQPENLQRVENASSRILQKGSVVSGHNE